MTVRYGQATALPRSSPNQLMVLDYITHECKATTVARSYDGYGWEGVLPTPLNPSCDKSTGACTIDIRPEEAGQYRVDMYDRTSTKDGKPTALQYALRLLAHGTFGSNMNQIEEFVSTFGNRTDEAAAAGGRRGRGRRLRGRYSREAHAAADGQEDGPVDDQILLKALRQANQTEINDADMAEAANEWFEAEAAKPTTSLREYFRQRASNRISKPMPQGGAYGICDVGSRWNKFTLMGVDKGTYGGAPSIFFHARNPSWQGATPPP